MSNAIKAVLFDFDYTLADSSIGVIDCANSALVAMGQPPAEPDRIRKAIGLPLTTTFLELTGRDHRAGGPRFACPSDRGPGEPEEEFALLFTKRADQVMARLTRVFDSVAPVVSTLRGRGMGLGIVSTKFRYRIEEILSREGLGEAFDVIVGGEDVGAHKPDPLGLLSALDRLGRASREALFVGDSIVDAETAQRAGVRFAAVLTGVTPREAFSDYPAAFILEGLAQLPGRI